MQNKYLQELRRTVDLDDDYGFKYIDLIQNALNRFPKANKYSYSTLKSSSTKRKVFEENKLKYEYSEAHHIIPKICGKDNSCNNIVLLYNTKKHPEHVLAHRYLSKSTSLFLDKKDGLKFAYILMIKNRNEYYSDEDAANLSFLSKFNKKPMTDITKQKLREKHTGKKLSEDTKRKISAAISGKNNPMYGKTGKNNPNYGRKNTAETIQKMKEVWTEDRRQAQKNNYNHKNKTIIKYNGNDYDVYQLSQILGVDYTTILRNIDKFDVVNKYIRKTKSMAIRILNDFDGEIYSVKQLEDVELFGSKRPHATILRWARNNKNGLHII